jgi:hypothetical protein
MELEAFLIIVVPPWYGLLFFDYLINQVVVEPSFASFRWTGCRFPGTLDRGRLPAIIFTIGILEHPAPTIEPT